MRNRSVLLWLLCLVLLGAFSCSDDSMDNPLVPPPSQGDTTAGEQEDDKEQGGTGDPEVPGDQGDSFPVVGSADFLNPALVDEHYILVNDAGANRAYIMDKKGQLRHEWELTNNIGNDVFLLPNGNVLASLESDDPRISFGGRGGRLQFVAPDNAVLWDFIYSTEDAETHHDAELLPNGNVIALVWEKRSSEEAVASGSMKSMDLYPEAVIEIDPATDQIVWEWHSWDHLVQDYDDSRSNFGVVSEHPELIDLNYVTKANSAPEDNGDIMHANAIAYDAARDLIFISVNFYSEVWVIDHSTTPAQAAGHTGGAFGKGGDLVYRFGNPEAYQNAAGTRLFYNNHFPNLLTGADQGKLLIFSNGNGPDQSTVYELRLPDALELIPNSDNEPSVLWDFTHPDLFSGKVSGAVELPNGNILITEGDFGFWEVTREKEVVWKFSAQGFFWRGYSYEKGAPEIKALGL